MFQYVATEAWRALKGAPKNRSEDTCHVWLDTILVFTEVPSHAERGPVRQVGVHRGRVHVVSDGQLENWEEFYSNINGTYTLFYNTPELVYKGHRKNRAELERVTLQTNRLELLPWCGVRSEGISVEFIP